MNPLIAKKGICDPHIHIYEGKAYLYATHDEPGYGKNFCMEDWHIYSSEDLIEWKPERVICPEEFYCGALNQCWAVDAAYRNGKFYWYFSTGSWGVGVGVGDCPSGPFQDVLGKALADYRTPPYDIPKWDPCVFIDDDGEAYLSVGYCREPAPWDCYLIARLNEDMVSLAEPFRKIEYIGNPCREDKPSIHKYGGRYYLTHSSYYAVSDNVYGPYQYMGNSGCNIDHGSYFSYNNQTYFASGGMDNPNQFFRASFLAPCHYRENGEIVVDQKIMGYGCGQYDAAWNQIEAEWYYGASFECKRELENGRFAVELGKKDFLSFPNIANIECNTSMQFYAWAMEGRACIEIREDSENGALLGKCQIVKTDNEEKFKLYDCILECTSGKKEICLVSDNKVMIDWFSFDNGKKKSTIEPAYAEFGGGAALKLDFDASMNRTLHNMELKGAFLTGLADGGAGGEGQLVIPYSCAIESVHLKLYINDIFQDDILFPVTEKEGVGKVPAQKLVSVRVRPGVNKIHVVSEDGYQNGILAIDHITLETRKSHYQTYVAADGAVEPAGNGCWDALPQRECDARAFGGRVVKYIGKPGYAVVVSDVDGGPGGLHYLEIRYCREENGTSIYTLEVNGEVSQHLLFEATCGESPNQAGSLRVQIRLESGKNNRICLRKAGREDYGIIVGSFAVIQKTMKGEIK